jgi:hypothetical protein
MASEYAEALRAKFSAVRLRTKWWGVTRKVDDVTRNTMAEAVGARSEEVHAKKYLVNTKHPKYKGCTKVRSNVKSFFKNTTNPWPEDGVRLCLREDIQKITDQVARAQSALDQAVAGLNEVYAEIREERRQSLGTMFREDDYPETLEGLFEVWLEFVNIEPPEYLQGENPRAFEMAERQALARLEEAVGLIETSMAEEFKVFLDSMVDRLGLDDQGKPKRFQVQKDGRCPVIDNLKDFFAKFKSMSLGSNEALDELVKQAEQVIQGVNPEGLRESMGAREAVREGMKAIGAQLDKMVELKPSRVVTFDD